MADRSNIEWTDASWNPISGCVKVSPGCAYCYAERVTKRFGGKPFLPGKAEIKLRPDRIDAPLHWKKPRLVFVNSMSDLFHEDVPDSFIAQIFAVMASAQQHTFQVLTKRPERMHDFITGNGVRLTGNAGSEMGLRAPRPPELPWWPLRNVWLGVSAENQRWLDARVPLLLNTPAAVRFVSLEPLLGPIDLRARPDKRMCLHCGGLSDDPHEGHPYRTDGGLDWVICGGESGGPEKRRLVEPCCRKGSPFPPRQIEHGEYRPYETVCDAYNRRECDARNDWRPKPEVLAWVRSLRDQCVAAGVPYFFKQFGGPRPTSGGRQLDGRIWDEMPGGIT